MLSAGSREVISQRDQVESDRAAVITPAEAESLLVDLAAVFLSNSPHQQPSSEDSPDEECNEHKLPKADAIYRALVEQIPAVIFMAHLDRGIGGAFFKPSLERCPG